MRKDTATAKITNLEKECNRQIPEKRYIVEQLDFIKILLCILLPNLAFKIISFFILLQRPLINLDYIFWALVSINFLRKQAVFFLTLLVIILDITVAVVPIYCFQIKDIPSIGKYIIYLDLKNLFFLKLFLVLAVLVPISMWFRSVIRSVSNLRSTIFLIFLGLSIISADVLNGTSSYLPERLRLRLVDDNIAFSASYSIGRAILENNNYFGKGRGNSNFKEVKSATEELVLRMRNWERNVNIYEKHIVLVIVESFGLSKNDEINKLLVEPYLKKEIQNRYWVKIGNIPCNGATTNAEFRELSGLDMNFHDALNGFIPISLPKYLRERGFKTLAIHGYTKNIFGRDIWYPAIGFDQMIFLEDLINKPNYHRCGSILRGSCDHELASLVREELLTAASKERLFIYWLTLNAHLPIVNYPVDQLLVDCDQLIQKPNGDDLCGLLKILLLTQLKIADIARAPNLEPTRFIIVGDHPPHFASVEKRGLFVKDRVPFIELLRRKEENK